MIKHTPGPWFVHEDKAHVMVQTGGVPKAEQFNVCWCGRGGLADGPSHEQVKADATLIALLAALKHLDVAVREHLEEVPSGYHNKFLLDRISQAYDAIQKAEGQQ